jgi:hypothetical protein
MQTPLSAEGEITARRHSNEPEPTRSARGLGQPGCEDAQISRFGTRLVQCGRRDPRDEAAAEGRAITAPCVPLDLLRRPLELRHYGPIWSTILPRVCLPATRASASRASSSGKAAST